MGRKKKLTAKVQQTIVQLIRGGNYKGVSARAAGITEGTMYRWLQEGEEAQSGVKFDFVAAVREAEALAEARMVALVVSHTITTWQAAAWWLERSHHERWGRKEKQELTGADGGPIQIQADVTAKQLEEYADIIRGLAGREPDESTGDDDSGESIHPPAPDP